MERENCKRCGVSFVKTRRDKMTCSTKCSNLYSQKMGRMGLTKPKPRGVRVRKSNPDLVQVYKDVEEFVLYMKGKNFKANEIDLFRLVDVYDKVYPDLMGLPKMSKLNPDYEMSSLIMFDKVVRWYVSNRDMIKIDFV
jgi:hypothetical protein